MVESAAMSATFWRLPLEYEPLHQIAAPLPVLLSLERTQQVDAFTASQTRPEGDVAGRIGQPAMYGDGLAPRVAAEDGQGAHVEAKLPEDGPNGRGLPRTVGSEEAVHLVLKHAQVQSAQSRN